jgi:hypothetical protein
MMWRALIHATGPMKPRKASFVAALFDNLGEPSCREAASKLRAPRSQAKTWWTYRQSGDGQ